MRVMEETAILQKSNKKNPFDWMFWIFIILYTTSKKMENPWRDLRWQEEEKSTVYKKYFYFSPDVDESTLGYTVGCVVLCFAVFPSQSIAG